MKKIIKKKDNIVKFPKNLNKLERQVELFYLQLEALDIETMKKEFKTQVI